MCVGSGGVKWRSGHSNSWTGGQQRLLFTGGGSSSGRMWSFLRVYRCRSAGANADADVSVS
ncbi:hypothetical protein BC567DRAFT_220889 [Phyllosticta citribraziliensis]